MFAVRPRKGAKGRCGRCEGRCAGYDRERRRRWRAPDLGLYRRFLDAEAPRVSCREQGLVLELDAVHHRRSLDLKHASRLLRTPLPFT